MGRSELSNIMPSSERHGINREAKAPSFAVTGLIVAVAVLSAVAIIQQFLLHRLSSGRSEVAEKQLPALNIRRLAGRRLVMAPDRPDRLHMPSGRAGYQAVERTDGAASEPAGGLQPPTTLLDNPAFRRAFETYREGMLDARYADLFRELDLSGDDLEHLKHLLAEKESLAIDVIAINQAYSRDTYSPEEIKAGVSAAEDEVEESIRSALGPQRYGQYQSYEETVPQRATVAQLERRLSYTSTPLTSSQQEGLIHVLAENAPAESGGHVPSVSLVLGGDASGVLPVVDPSATGLVTDSALAHASGLLLPQQLAALRQLQAEQMAIIQAGNMIMDGSNGLQGQAPNWGLLLQ